MCLAASGVLKDSLQALLLFARAQEGSEFSLRRGDTAVQALAADSAGLLIGFAWNGFSVFSVTESAGAAPAEARRPPQQPHWASPGVAGSAVFPAP